MKISFIRIQNFRKLKNVQIDFDGTTLFVGANNSGKTSAMDALRKFLIKSEFIINDFTITTRDPINKIGEAWTISDAVKPTDFSDFIDIVPSMDVWLDVNNNEFHYVAHIIPTLDWTGGKLGVRLSYLPKDIDKLFDDFKATYQQARNTENCKGGNKLLNKLFPVNLCDFIEKNISKHFEIKSFILDPVKINESQKTDSDNECDNKNPFEKLIKIDMIDAQRGFADPDSKNDVVSLSRQFRTYYDKHLDIDKETSPEDLETLEALENATIIFNRTLKEKFTDALNELKSLGYPGITDPKISIESKIKEKTAFDHDSAVQYALSDEDDNIRLPEKYNGLGYQNLISIVFKLISFRDDRIYKGKALNDDNSDYTAPLHLVLLEEPEAHLHIQVQQVLIKKAYDVLTKGLDSWLSTQLVVSTHSSHIAKEVDFNKIRYFKRITADSETRIPTAEVVNLTNTFGKDELTEIFVQRYIQVTHCDLFFADAVIFVEGTSENVLVPYFIKNNFNELDSRYITILPVGGRHSHKFKPLVNKLLIPTLIITDLDSVNPTGYHEKAIPKIGAKLISGNPSIKEWGIKDNALDYLLSLKDNDKILQDNKIKLAYQTPVTISINKISGDVLSSTFEETLIYANLSNILELNLDGIVEKVKKACLKTQIDDFNTDIFNAIHNTSDNKVSFAIELLYKLNNVNTPLYISEGLTWLQEKLRSEEVINSVGSVINE